MDFHFLSSNTRHTPHASVNTEDYMLISSHARTQPGVSPLNKPQEVNIFAGSQAPALASAS
jgi:hypothetical protein